jgi:DnaD/phage-associated family protein
MTTIRVKKDDHYFAASNEPFNDKRLSWEARGLMGYLLSKPNNWQVRMTDLENQGPAGGRKLKRMLAELRMCRYMNRIRVKLPNGKFDWITEVYESPAQNPNKSTSGTFCTSAISTSAKQPDIVITESPSTDSLEIEGNDRKVFTALENLIGSLGMDTPRYVDTWLEKHTVEWILKAVGIAKDKGARSVKYVDSVLIGWEANGYPKSREQQVAERKGKPAARPATNFDTNMAHVQDWLKQAGANNG